MGATERWIQSVEIFITVHTENDGAVFLRRGPEHRDERLTFDEYAQRHGREQAVSEVLKAIGVTEETVKVMRIVVPTEIPTARER